MACTSFNAGLSMWATPYKGITGTAPVAQASVAESSVVLPPV